MYNICLFYANHEHQKNIVNVQKLHETCNRVSSSEYYEYTRKKKYFFLFVRFFPFCSFGVNEIKKNYICALNEINVVDIKSAMSEWASERDGNNMYECIAIFESKHVYALSATKAILCILGAYKAARQGKSSRKEAEKRLKNFTHAFCQV